MRKVGVENISESYCKVEIAIAYLIFFYMQISNDLCYVHAVCG